MKSTLEAFSKKFVKKTYQERCVHDAIKKPGKLMYKICHNISAVFDDKFLFKAEIPIHNKKCYFYCIGGQPDHTTWDAAVNEINLAGGGGYLIIEEGGNRFYAESEGQPP